MKTEILTIVTAGIIVSVWGFIWMGKVLSEWQKEQERDLEPIPKAVSEDKQKAFDFVKRNLKSALTGSHLTSVYQMLQCFRRKYGKCEEYCELYADYVEQLYDYNERNSLQHTV